MGGPRRGPALARRARRPSARSASDPAGDGLHDRVAGDGGLGRPGDHRPSARAGAELAQQRDRRTAADEMDHVGLEAGDALDGGDRRAPRQGERIEDRPRQLGGRRRNRLAGLAAVRRRSVPACRPARRSADRRDRSRCVRRARASAAAASSAASVGRPCAAHVRRHSSSSQSPVTFLSSRTVPFTPSSLVTLAATPRSDVIGRRDLAPDQRPRAARDVDAPTIGAQRHTGNRARGVVAGGRDHRAGRRPRHRRLAPCRARARVRAARGARRDGVRGRRPTRRSTTGCRRRAAGSCWRW